MARRCGPFDGLLATLLDRPEVVLAETYPADIYGQIGLAFRPGMSKRRQANGAALAPALLAWAARRGMRFAPELNTLVWDGFGAAPVGDDQFDAVTGLFGMLEVVQGHRAEGVPDLPHVHVWEGWILVQSSTNAAPPLAA